MERYTTIQNIKKAILRGECSYSGAPLPNPQSAGTYYQQATYAMVQAQQVFERYFKDKTNHI